MVDGVTAVDPSCRQSVVVARSMPTANMASLPAMSQKGECKHLRLEADRVIARSSTGRLLPVIRSLGSSPHLVRLGRYFNWILV